MGKFEIFFSPADFYVTRMSETDTGSSVIYEYEIVAPEGESLTLTIPGSNKIINQDGVKSTLVNGVFTFSSLMTFSFSLTTGSSLGVFTDGVVRVERNTFAASQYGVFEEDVLLLKG